MSAAMLLRDTIGVGVCAGSQIAASKAIRERIEAANNRTFLFWKMRVREDLFFFSIVLLKLHHLARN